MNVEVKAVEKPPTPEASKKIDDEFVEELLSKLKEFDLLSIGKKF